MLYSYADQPKGLIDDSQFDTFFAREEWLFTDVPRLMDLRYNKAAIGAVVSGSFDYRAQNGAATAVPGSIILGNAGEGFDASHPDSMGNHRVVIWFDRAFLAGVASSLGLDNIRFDRAVLPPGDEASRMFAQLRSAAFCGDEDRACNLLATALTIPAGRPESYYVSLQDRRRILSIVRFINTEFSEPRSIAELAALSGFDRFRFMRLFKQVTGTTASQYLAAARLRAAVDRLLQSDAPITEIALSLGFSDSSHLNHSFKAAFRCTPREMRRRMCA